MDPDLQLESWILNPTIIIILFLPQFRRLELGKAFDSPTAFTIIMFLYDWCSTRNTSWLILDIYLYMGYLSLFDN